MCKKCVKMCLHFLFFAKYDMPLLSYTHFLSGLSQDQNRGCGLMIFPRARTLFTSYPSCCPNEKRTRYQQKNSESQNFSRQASHRAAFRQKYQKIKKCGFNSFPTQTLFFICFYSNTKNNSFKNPKKLSFLSYL